MASREKDLIYKREYYARNKARHQRKQRTWYANNREANLEYQKLWKQKNLERVKTLKRIHNTRRKSRARSAPGAFTSEQLFAKCEYWGWRCYLCAVPLSRDGFQIEHRIPLSRGGSHWIANIAPSCPKCNLAKGNKTEPEFRALRLVA